MEDYPYVRVPIALLLANLMVRNPFAFADLLELGLRDEETRNYVQLGLDHFQGEYTTWFSPPLTFLTLLVQRYTYQLQERTISPELGIRIIDLLLEYDVSFETRNYYRETLEDVLNDEWSENTFRDYALSLLPSV